MTLAASSSLAVILGISAVVLLFLVLLGVMIFASLKEERRSSDSIGGRPRAALVPRDEPTEPDLEATAEPDTSPPFDLRDPQTAPVTESPQFALPRPSEIREQEGRNPELAAHLWERLGRWRESAKCYETAGKYQRAAHIWLALENYERALPLLRTTLREMPDNEQVRLRLIETLTDLGLEAEAEEVAAAVLGDESPVKPSSRFHETIGRIHEALGHREKAIISYTRALEVGDESAELQQRLVFLRQLGRLREEPAKEAADQNKAKEILQRYIEESTRHFERRNGSGTHKLPSQGDDQQEIIVGHLALGFQHPEPRCSVRSVFSLSRRFLLVRLISESPRGAVFEAYDRLLDFPVALRLHRLPSDISNLDALRERLQQIAQLNHPNLAKVTFVEREGPILIIATEYLPGGNLRDFLKKLGGVGLPLLIRMALHLSSGVQTSHWRGIPHGDIRPENIIIGTDQRIKLVDFAISPIPVIQDGGPESNSGTDSAETPRYVTTENLAVQSDLLQFADTLKFMLDHVRYIPATAAHDGVDPMEEMKELVKRVQGGEFTSMLRLSQILEQIFERTLPPAAETPKLRK